MIKFRGGNAIPIGRNTFLMRGRTHEQGGIDIGNQLEVEDNEVVKFNKGSVKVLSAQPILNGMAPSMLALRGGSFNKLFNTQEYIKKKIGINDDGSKKALGGDTDEPLSKQYDELRKKYKESVEKYNTLFNKAFEGKDYIEQDINYFTYMPKANKAKIEKDNIKNQLTDLTLDMFPQLSKLTHVSDTEEGTIRYFKNNGIYLRDNKEITDYFKSYIDSKGMDRILENQKTWYNNRHPFRKYIEPAETNKLRGYLRDNIKNPIRIFGISGYPEMSSFLYNAPKAPSLNRSIFLYEARPRQNDEFITEEALGHEFAHGVQPGIQTNAQKEVLDQNTNTEKGHDSKYSEKHADSWGLKWLLYKEGIYDSRSDKDVTPEQIREIREKYPNLRIFKQFEGDDNKLSWYLNHIASNTNNKQSNNKVLAKFGGNYIMRGGGKQNRNIYNSLPENVQSKLKLIGARSDDNIKKLVYYLGSQKGVKDNATANRLNMAAAATSFMLHRRAPLDDRYVELKQYLYPDATDENGNPLFEETTDNTGFDYTRFIKDNLGDINVKTYKGILNPRGEYLIDGKYRDYITGLAKANKHIYGNADVENAVKQYNDFYEQNEESVNYRNRNDVANYIQKYKMDKKGNIYVDASDLYDFDNSEQGKLMQKVGTPYILRQPNIPVRFIDDYETLSNDALYNMDNMSKIIEASMKKFGGMKNTIHITPFTGKLPQYKCGGVSKKPFGGQDWLQLGNTIGNIGFGLATGIMNNRALNKMQYAPKLIPQQAMKIKTNYNINPQVKTVNDITGRMINDTVRNTASSRGTLQRVNLLRNNAMNQLSSLYGSKENAETQLINQDIANRQGIANTNIQNFNNWRAGKVAFENDIRDKKVTNWANVMQQGSAAINNFANYFGKSRADANNFALTLATNPEAAKILLKDDYSSNDLQATLKALSNYYLKGYRI